MHDWGEDHEHFGEEEDETSNILWLMDNVELKSVGIDIGSAGTQVIFSRIQLQRIGEDLSSRFTVVKRETVYRSPVHLTPYLDETRIDDQAVGRIIADAYEAAGIRPEAIDTGAVILTGEAIRRENARALAEVLAVNSGRFVCASAGHNMEALLAAYGSGAVGLSKNRDQRILNIDIGGGTTKLAVVERGRVLETAAFYVGGRLVVVDETGTIVRLDPGGRSIGLQLGLDLSVGKQISSDTMARMAHWMAEAVVSAVRMRPLPERLRAMYLTPVLEQVGHFDGVVFSGGVAEYVYGQEDRDFGDLGRLLGMELRRLTQTGAIPWPLIPASECIRATVVGASEYSIQVSGNTIFISDPELLPVKNLQVLHPVYALDGEIEPEALARAIGQHFQLFDLEEGRADVALSFHWRGDPEYRRVAAFCRGIVDALPRSIAAGKPLVVVLDGDIARTVGTVLKREHGLHNEVISIDGIQLQDFDFIDIGRRLEPAAIVPVTVKSLVFQL